MRLVLQRVKQAKVNVGSDLVGAIGQGWLVLVGIGPEDDTRDIEVAVDKTINLRMFPDEDGKFNKSLLDIRGEVLLVSQFTLFGDCRKGRRPSFANAASQDAAYALYDDLVKAFKQVPNLKVETGKFQAHMEVSLVNDGPVTMLVDTKRNF